MTLGIGAGWNAAELRNHGVAFRDRWKVTRERVLAMRRIWSDEVADCLHGCPFIVVESNHDPQMLFDGPYPSFLKRRVSSRRGHLSNVQTRALLDRIADPVLDCVVLAHLSESNNTPELAHAAVAGALAGSDVRVVVAAPRAPSEAFEPRGQATFEGPPRQLCLF